MATINERFMDFQIAQQIKWIRLQNRDVQEALKILNRVDAQLEGALIRAGIGDAPFTLARLEALKAQVTNLIAVVHGEAAEVLTANMTSAAEAAGAVEEQLFRRTMPAGLDVTTPNLGVLQQAATLRPFNGAVMGDWVEELKANDLKRTWNHILDGITSGTDTPSLIRSLIGSKPLKYKDGLREVSRRGMEALVRTSINHATNQGRQMVWEANSDIIKGVRWVSTLDTRTTPICQQRDGRVGPVSTLEGWTPPEGADVLDPPFARPPAHPNCRSTTCAVTKSWRELGFDMDEMPAGTRASMDGQVPANMTYFEWLAKQSPERQKDVLGQTRYDMWHKDGIDPERFINDKGVRLTIKQIRELPPEPDVTPDLAFTIADYKQVGRKGDFTYALNKIPQWKPTPWTSIDEAFAYDKLRFEEFRELSITGESVRRFEKLALKDLTSAQQTVRLENLEPILTKYDPAKIDKPPVVYRMPDGQLVLRDGNHRVNAALANGVKEMEFDVIDYMELAPKKPKITRLTEFNTNENGLNWFTWKKDLQLRDYFERLDPEDFGLKAWPNPSNLHSIVDPDIAGAIGKVAVEQGRGDVFAIARAKQDLKTVLWEKRGIDGKLLHPEPAPLKFADVFDLTDFATAQRTSNNLNKFEYIYYLDPKEFGLKFWPSIDVLRKAATADSAGVLGDMRMIIINSAPGGKPKRYMTSLQKRIDKIVNPPKPVVIKNALIDIDGKPATLVTKAEFLAHQKELGIKNLSIITTRWNYYEEAIQAMKEGRQLTAPQHGAYRMAQRNTNPTEINLLWDAYQRSGAGGQQISRNNTQPEPFRVGTGAKILRESEALQRKMQKAYDVMPNWVLNEIKDVTKPTISANQRAFYNPWDGELHLAATDGADVWVHEMFHALDFQLRFKGKPLGQRMSYEKNDSLDWVTDDANLNRLAAATRAEFKNRDGKGVGVYKHNKDGEYWLGDWENSYEGRKYAFDVETSSEYITMGAQSYASAKMRGDLAFRERRDYMQKKQPAMLALLDYIWTRLD